MGRLRVLSGREACDLLADHGFQEIRQKGSHVVMQRRLEDGGTVTLHREIRRGTLRAIVRQSGLPRQLFEVD